MKRILSICSLFFLCISICYAQDIIVQKDGTTIKAKVTKVSDKEVEYKKFGSNTDRVYSLETSTILSINYEDGEVEKFNTSVNSSEPEQQPIQQTTIAATPMSDNGQIIAKYNKSISVKKAATNKSTRVAFLVMGINNNSILSTEELEIDFITKVLNSGTGCKARNDFHFRGGPFQISIKNKTDKIIYIDLGSTFRTEKDGLSHTYYNTDIVTTSTGGESGGAFNLGGITGALGIGGAVGSLAGATTLGSSTTSGISRTRQMQRVISIPPHGMNVLSKFEVACSKKKCQRVSYNEMIPGENIDGEFEWVSFDDKNKLEHPLHKDEVIEYTQDNSIGVNTYQITYTSDPNFMKLKTITFGTYLKYIVGSDKNSGDYEDMYKETIDGEITDVICDVWWKMGKSIGPKK